MFNHFIFKNGISRLLSTEVQRPKYLQGNSGKFQKAKTISNRSYLIIRLQIVVKMGEKFCIANQVILISKIHSIIL